MNKILAIIILTLSFNICSQDANSAKFFPLKTGNKWFYHVTTLGYPNPTYSIKTLRVLNDTTVNNRKYFKIKGYPFSNIDDTNTVLIRYDSVNGLLKQSTLWAPCNYESTLFRLSSQIGDTTGICYETWQYTCSMIRDTILFNQLTQIKTFRYDISGHNTLTVKYNFLKYIGLYQINNTSSGNSGAYGRIGELRGFILNGIVYGDTSSVIGINPISNYNPNQFSLSQNYPNPFNPTTKIRFSIPATPSPSGRVRVGLVIYDILGREVATLVNEDLKPGTYEINWDASNYVSGVYFYKLTSGEFSETKRMVLVK